MEVATVVYIIGFRVEFFRHGIQPWEHASLGPVVTVLFIISNVLLFRRRRWAILGFVVCWLIMALALLPTA